MNLHLANSSQSTGSTSRRTGLHPLRLYTILLCALAVAVAKPVSAAPCPPDAVAWWKAQGDATDSVGMNDGTLMGGATFAPGQVGMAFSFDGVDDYVSIPDAPALRPANITIEGWFFPTDFTKTSVLVGKRVGVDVHNSYALFIAAGGTPGGFISDGSTLPLEIAFSANPPLALNTWHHLALTFDDATDEQILYVNGLADAMDTTTQSIGYDGSPVLIGHDVDPGEDFFFPGLADEVSIYSRALTPAEILEIAGAGMTGKCTGGDAPPTITCPPDQTLVSVDAGVCGAVVTYADPVAMDDMAGFTVMMTAGIASGMEFPVGTTTVTFEVTDSAMQTAQCSFDVTVVDDENPVIDPCPGNISQSVDPGICTAAVSWTAPTAMDNCAGVMVSCSPMNGSAFPAGTTQVTCTATDAAGNTDECMFDVMVTEDEDPVIGACPAPIMTSAGVGLCTAAVTYTAPTATDNCGMAPVVCAPVSGSAFAVGTTAVTCTATDPAGNTAQCMFDVTVTDDEVPALGACPPGSLTADATMCSAVVNYANPMATDNCPGVMVACAPASGTTFPVGMTSVTCTATDAAGNTAQCMFDVTVTDDENPTIGACPADMTVSVDPGMCTAAVTWTAPTAMDNCAGVSVSCSPMNGSPLSAGTTVVTCTATDAAGNTSDCMFSVTVTEDEVPAIGACPAAINTGVDPGMCGAAVTFTPPTATDNCPGVSVACLPASGATFPVGLTMVTCTATDAAGNTAECMFNVTVTDDEDPTIVCPAPIMIGTDPGVCDAAVTWTTPTGMDNCPGVTVGCSPMNGSTFSAGVTAVTCTATDAAGNTAECMFDVTVSDAEDPMIGACPADMTVSADVGMCDAAVTWTAPGATDNCPGMPLVACSPMNGSTFPAGTTPVTCTATDAAGNTDQCTFNVTVTETEDPVIGACPAVIMTSADPSLCTAVATWINPMATDNCPGVTVACAPPSGNAFPLGTTLVTCTATDGAGNTAECTFDVTVTDDEAPVVTCPAAIMTGNDAGVCEAVVSWTPPIATDNCPGVMVGCTPMNGSAFPVGTTSVTCTATDGVGNTSVCNFDVTVTDNEDPMIGACPAPIVTGVDPGMCTATVTWTPPGATDNCPGATVSCSPMNGSPFTAGTTPVTCTATDAAGNTAECMFDVTVTEDEDPVIGACPAAIMTSVDPGTCGAVVTFTPPTATDNCPGETVACVPASGATFALGLTTVTCTATDAAGNTAECMFDVTVVDDEAPSITGGDVMVSVDPGLCTASGATLAPPTNGDNCPGATTSNDAPANLPLGLTVVMWMVTDSSGNFSSANVNVTVVDDEDPTITCPPDLTVNADPGVCTASMVALGIATTTDNCPGVSGSNDAPGTFPPGTTAVTWTATDAAGNTATCVQMVTVAETEDPTITCPADLTVNTDMGSCTANGPDLGMPATADNCGVALVSNDAPAVFPIGLTTVTWLVKDTAGNMATCMQTVTVIEVAEPPTITCPANITTPANPVGSGSAVVNYTPPVGIDNCPGATTVCSPAPGATFLTGPPTVVTCTVTDAGANTAQCMFTVTVTTVVGNPRVTSGLVVLYDFAEGMGTTVNDVSGVGTPLNLTIQDPAKIQWIGGGSRGVQIVNTGSAITSPGPATKVHTALSASSRVSIEAWVKPNDLAQFGPRRIVTLSEGIASGQMNMHLGQGGGTGGGDIGSFRLRTSANSFNWRQAPGLFTTTMDHVHVIVTYDGTAQRVYLNGVQVGTPQGATGNFSTWNPSYPLVLGNEATLDRSWLGCLSLVAIYDKALSGAEVQQNFNAGLQTNPSAPQITQQPANRTVIEPSGATFQVGAIGTAPLSYQWHRGAMAIPGATASSYTLTPTSVAGDNGAMFRVVVSNGLGMVTSQFASLTVSPAGTLPTANLALWLQADSGVVTNSPEVVQWTDQSINNRHATQAVVANQPKIVPAALNGLPVVRFDGVNDFLTFNLPVNGQSGMTLFLVAANTQNQNGGFSQTERAAIFWDETANWGQLYLNPYQTQVTYRFGSTQAGNQPSYTRPISAGSNFTLSTAIKDGTMERLRVNKNQVLSQSGKLSTIAGCQSTGNLGRGFLNTHFAGDIAEVLVFLRALTPAEIDLVENYLDSKYGLTTPEGPSILTQPSNFAVVEPNPATFEVLATGSAPLSYQWQRDATDIPGATDSSYTLPSTTQGADNGAQFRVVVSNAIGMVTSQVATLTVNAPGALPANAALWLMANAGVVTNSPEVVQWVDQSGNNRHAIQANTPNQPIVVPGALNGLPVVRFDGANDFLLFNLPVNGQVGMTLFLVAANTQNQNGGFSQTERAALFWDETANWGQLYLNPYQSQVTFRFGTTQAGNQPFYNRPMSAGNNFTLSTAVKDGATERLRVNKNQVLTQGGKLPTIAGCRDTGNLGRGFQNTFFAGDIAEVLVFLRALTPSEIDVVEAYLDTKYGLTAPEGPSIQNHPADFTVVEPNPATFQVVASGTPPLSYQWRRGGMDIPGATDSSYTLDPTSQAMDNAAMFDVRVSNGLGMVTSTPATLTVNAPSSLPAGNLALWLRADAGLLPGVSGVTQWTDQSGNNRHATQQGPGNQPMAAPAFLNGLPVLRFDGVNDFMTFNLPVNGLSGMTIFLVAANTQNQNGGFSQTERAAIFWNETAFWGQLYLNPYQTQVTFRFGTTQAGNQPFYNRPASLGSGFSVSTATKNGTTDTLHVNGTQVVNQAGKLPTIAGCGSVGNLGRGFLDTFFAGDIAEVIVYTRALTPAERQTVESYLNGKYNLNPPPPFLPPTNQDVGFTLHTEVDGGDTVRLELRGQPGDSYIIERSSDLSDWTPVTTITLPINGSGVAIERIAVDEPTGYFRARLD